MRGHAIPSWTPDEVAAAEAKYLADCIRERVLHNFNPLTGTWTPMSSKGTEPVGERPSHFRPQRAVIAGQEFTYSSDAELNRLKRRYRGAPVTTFPFVPEGCGVQGGR